MLKKINPKLVFNILLFVILLILTAALVSSASVEYKTPLHRPTLPEHPQLSMQGVYQTALFQGAATYSYPITTPPGTNGLQPSFSLNYNSQNTKSKPGLVGTAWTITQNYIQRDVDYSFADTSDDKFKLILNGQSYDLVYVPSEDRYHTKIESYLYIKKETGGNNANNEYWIVKTKDGTTYRFGYNQDSEMVSNLHSYTWRWSLDLVTDVHNNKIFYSHLENPYSGDLGAVYLSKIEYNNNKERKIEFVYEINNRPDSWTVYEQGQKLRRTRRLKEIQVFANNNLVRKYVIDYVTADINTRTFISSITQYGKDGSTSLPSVSFSYNSITKGWEKDNSWTVPAIAAFSDDGHDVGGRLLDLNRDGLVDISIADDQEYQTWLNTGNGWTESSSWHYTGHRGYVFRYGGEVLGYGVRFGDINGDGFVDIVHGDETKREVFLNNGVNSWTSGSWSLPSDAYFTDADKRIFERGLRLLDANGDSLVDLLISRDDGSDEDYIFWLNTGSNWVESTIWQIPDSDNVDFCRDHVDQGARLVDINNDGLVDVIGEEGTLINNGNGWTKSTDFDLPGSVAFVSNNQDEGLRVGDVNGDGLPDLILANEFEDDYGVWLNTGTGWTADFAWNVPTDAAFMYLDNAGVRLADVNGDSLIDLVKADGPTTEERGTWLNKAAKGYLLNTITTSLGGTISINYKKSTYIDNKGGDSVSDLGFNVWTIDSLICDNGIINLQNILSTTAYDYLGGFFDYEDKEFRGFNFVKESLPYATEKEHFYHQDDAKSSLEYETNILGNGNPHNKIQYLWTSTQKDGYYVVQLKEVTNYEYNGE